MGHIQPTGFQHFVDDVGAFVHDSSDTDMVGLDHELFDLHSLLEKRNTQLIAVVGSHGAVPSSAQTNGTIGSTGNIPATGLIDGKLSDCKSATFRRVRYQG